MDAGVTIGIIRRAHGLRGEVVVADVTDGGFEPAPGMEVTLVGPAAETATRVEKWRRRGNAAVVKFACSNDRAAAEKLRRGRVSVAADALPPPPADAFYDFEIVGLPVETTSGEPVGTVAAVYAAGAQDILVIANGERTFDVPFVRAHVAEVRRSEKVVIVPHREG